MFTITGTVYGSTRFPDAPDHEGGWGLIGGEDCFVARNTFTSVGAAMTWCRKVLLGQVKPRFVQWQGPLLTPNTGLEWRDARVLVESATDTQFYASEGPKWFLENLDGTKGAMVRDDEVYFGQVMA